MSLETELDSFLSERSFEKDVKIAVALSGGADSLCLTILLNQWCLKNHHQLVAITVDHGIRPESADEAESVHSQMEQLGIRHVILSADRSLCGNGLEERARDMRYELMTNYCKKNQISVLCIAHHLQDQAETFFARLSRGSGLDGLCGIRPVSYRNDIAIVRPFLSVSKNRIVTYLNDKGIPFVQDPMNDDQRYERVRWRMRLPFFEKNDLSARSVCLSTMRLNRVREALEHYTRCYIRRAVVFHEMGFCFIPMSKWRDEADEIRLRCMQYLIGSVGSVQRSYSYEQLEKELFSENDFTLSGCLIVKTNKGIFVAPEHRLFPDSVFVPALKKQTWHGFSVCSTVELKIMLDSPLQRLPDIPALIQKGFLHLKKCHATQNRTVIFIASCRYTEPVLFNDLKIADLTENKKTTTLFVPVKLIEKLEKSPQSEGKDVLKKILAKTANLDYNDQNTDIVYIQSELMRKIYAEEK